MIDDCSLMDGYGILVQLSVAIISFSSLLMKRYVEAPKRPWLIWFFDVSQQTFAAAAIHCVNLLAATMSSSQMVPSRLRTNAMQDQCVWYLTNVIVDSTILLFLMTVFLKVFHWLVHIYGFDSLIHGDYGNPPRYSNWLQQLVAYSLLLFSAKGISLLFLYKYSDFFNGISSWMLRPINDQVFLKLLVVIMIVPICTSIIQYLLFDYFIKANWKNTRRRGITDGWQVILPEELGFGGNRSSDSSEECEFSDEEDDDEGDDDDRDSSYANYLRNMVPNFDFVKGNGIF